MPRFVLLEHRWDGVHWDLMLEVGDALRTWALDAPAVEPGVTLPARALPDHRLIYLEYEGEVSGGRGVVRRVDRGTYEVRQWEPDRVRVRLEGDQLRGEVELVQRAEDGGENAPGWTFRWETADDRPDSSSGRATRDPKASLPTDPV